eukprot:ctg_357.g228
MRSRPSGGWGDGGARWRGAVRHWPRATAATTVRMSTARKGDSVEDSVREASEQQQQQEQQRRRGGRAWMDGASGEAASTPKNFEHRACEEAIYRWWEETGRFSPDALPEGVPHMDRRPFVIVMPPPNVTGGLHMGHAIGTTIEDILVRFQAGGARPAGRGLATHRPHPRAIPGARVGVEAEQGRLHYAAAAAAGRQRRLVARTLHPERRDEHRGGGGVCAPASTGPGVSRQLHGELESDAADGGVRPGGGVSRRARHALLLQIPGGGRRARRVLAGGHHAPRDHSGGHGGVRASERCPLRPLHWPAGGGAHRRPSHPGYCGRVRGSGVWHRGVEDHAGARPQRLPDRQAAQSAGADGDRQGCHHDHRRGGRPLLRSGPFRVPPAPVEGYARRRPDRAAHLHPVVHSHEAVGGARHRGGAQRADSHPAGALRKDLLRLAGGRAGLVRVAPALVGPSHSGVLRERPGGCVGGGAVGGGGSAVGAGALRRRRAPRAGPGRVGHLVLVGIVAVLHDGLAGRVRHRLSPLLPGHGHGDRLRYPLLLGGAHDHVERGADRPGAVRDGVSARAGAGCRRPQNEQDVGQRDRPAGGHRPVWHRCAAHGAGDRMHARPGHSAGHGESGGEPQLCQQIVECGAVRAERGAGGRGARMASGGGGAAGRGVGRPALAVAGAVFVVAPERHHRQGQRRFGAVRLWRRRPTAVRFPVGRLGRLVRGGEQGAAAGDGGRCCCCCATTADAADAAVGAGSVLAAGASVYALHHRGHLSAPAVRRAVARKRGADAGAVADAQRHGGFGGGAQNIRHHPPPGRKRFSGGATGGAGGAGGAGQDRRARAAHRDRPRGCPRCRPLCAPHRRRRAGGVSAHERPDRPRARATAPSETAAATARRPGGATQAPQRARFCAERPAVGGAGRSGAPPRATRDARQCRPAPATGRVRRRDVKRRTGARATRSRHVGQVTMSVPRRLYDVLPKCAKWPASRRPEWWACRPPPAGDRNER